MSQIKFYRTREEGGFMSNFFVGTPIVFNGHVFRTSEHLYQALKVGPTDPEAFNKIRDAKTAKEAAAFGRDPSIKLRPDWEEAKIWAMRMALLLKFEEAELRVQLLDTGDAELVEDTSSSGDKVWGQVNGEGQNLLGKLLMEIRTFYRDINDVSPHEEAAEISQLQSEIANRLRGTFKKYMP